MGAQTVGVNAIREACRRCPLAMNETLLQDLVQYKKSKNKGVSMAARSLLALYREVNPTLLKRKERGKRAAMEPNQVKAYGELRPASGVDGVELLLEDNEISTLHEPEKKLRLDVAKLLTDEDFERIEVLKLEKEMGLNPTNSKKRSRADVEAEYAVSSEIQEEVTPGDIESFVKKRKMTYEERLAHIRAGREDFEYGSKKGKKHAEKGLSSTNEMKAKQNKPFHMAQKSRRVKEKT